MAFTFERESASQIPVRFCVGDRVNVLVACHLPQRETVQRTGVIERITHQTSDGTPLYWISGVLCAQTAHTLRLVLRADR